MKKIWIIGALMACLSGSVAMADSAPNALDTTQYSMVQGARKNSRGNFQNALYLDRHSIHVVDVADDGMIVTADVLEMPEKGRVTKHSTKYKLAEDGTESILGLDGNWYALPKNSDDPAAVAAMKVRDELGNAEKREQFVTEIQHILLKKQEASSESTGPNEGNPPPSAEAVVTPAAPAVTDTGTAEGNVAENQGQMPPDAAEAYAKSSAVRSEAEKPADDGTSAEQEQGNEAPSGDANANTEPSSETPEPKDTDPAKKEEPSDPPVVVQIESHQPPQVKVEIKGHDEN